MHRFTYYDSDGPLPHDELSLRHSLRQTPFGVVRAHESLFMLSSVHQNRIWTREYVRLPCQLVVSVLPQALSEDFAGAQELVRVMSADWLLSCGFTKEFSSFIFTPQSRDELYASLLCLHYAPYRQARVVPEYQPL